MQIHLDRNGTNVAPLHKVWGKKNTEEDRRRSGALKKRIRGADRMLGDNGFVLSRWSTKYYIFTSSNGSKSFLHFVCLYICVSKSVFALFVRALNIVNCTHHCSNTTPTYSNAIRLGAIAVQSGFYLVLHAASRSPLPLLTNNCQVLNKI